MPRMLRMEQDCFYKCESCNKVFKGPSVGHVYVERECPCRRGYVRDMKLPTLREWLGDEVIRLGKWADVLRDHPSEGWTWGTRYGELVIEHPKYGHMYARQIFYAINVLEDMRKGTPAATAYDRVLSGIFTGPPPARYNEKKSLGRPRTELGSNMPRGYWDPYSD